MYRILTFILVLSLLVPLSALAAPRPDDNALENASENARFNRDYEFDDKGRKKNKSDDDGYDNEAKKNKSDDGYSGKGMQNIKYEAADDTKERTENKERMENKERKEKQRGKSGKKKK